MGKEARSASVHNICILTNATDLNRVVINEQSYLDHSLAEYRKYFLRLYDGDKPIPSNEKKTYKSHYIASLIILGFFVLLCIVLAIALIVILRREKAFSNIEKSGAASNLI
ncbi:hypothetical protein TVAG_464950 [Trichomonas vaginalis G3]|uniref:Uncharacterized protein n=1 Tax=Trichomonas vaginalis (strain ATCC PRA-98 / G3) TaxID=412133 RepID=A2DTW0_TRIV3|nr:hypothetical protein TVAG_464950 [Trichomonas vaginalis G3]|eukprot:XP_001328330.1 hypothetical protein [Trichomonas vaginalis G3]